MKVYEELHYIRNRLSKGTLAQEGFLGQRTGTGEVEVYLLDVGAQARRECTCAQVYLGHVKICLIDRSI